MTRSRTAVVVTVIAIVAWWGVTRVRSAADPEAAQAAQAAQAAHRTIGHDLGDALAKSHARSAKLPHGATSPDGDVTIAGRVIDVRQQQPVGNVEVVFHSASGETSTTTRADGSYAIKVATGMYRAFIRDDTVLSVGRPELVRLPGLPSAETAGVPDEALMALVLASADTEGVDLSVVRGGIVSGRVVDRGGRPIAGAVLRARGGGVRPTLATDIAETDNDGSFELRLPAGGFVLDASHPRFAGIASATAAQISVQPGDHVQTTLTLIAGCVISGHVVGHDGKPAGDGAIEQKWGQGDLEFAPAGRIEPDGTFRWSTMDEADITLRAWPWKSPPSPVRQFACRDGARFDNVVFQLTDLRPDVSGVLIDKAGEPVGSAFIDLQPLDPGGIGQQERTDAAGRWDVYRLPPGRYRVMAQAEGRGVTTQTIVSPASGVRLELGGTGRIEGTTTRLTSGSFELALGACLDGTTMISLPQSHRLVTVTGGRFTIDDVPACELTFSAIWHGHPIAEHASIPSGGTAHVDIELGPPHAKTVHGVVRDGTGRPVAGAQVSASFPSDPDDTTATTDSTGAYTMKTFSGASLHAVLGARSGFAEVSGDNVSDEQLDFIVEDAPDSGVAPDDHINIIDDDPANDG